MAYTVVDVACFDPRSGLMAADAAMHESLLDQRQVEIAVDRAAGRRGVRRAREVLDLASPLVESPLESLTHLALHDSGFPPPELQVWLNGADGKRYRVDFYWPEYRAVLEADGRSKYHDDALWCEKARDLALRRAGYRVEHIRWVDVLEDWHTIAAWLGEQLGLPSNGAN